MSRGSRVRVLGELLVYLGAVIFLIGVRQSVAQAPIITKDLPAEVTVRDGEAIEYTVSASGSELEYERYLDGARVRIARSSTYRTRPNRLNRQGRKYQVKVVNALGERWSGISTVKVIPQPPKITFGPRARKVREGMNYQLLISVRSRVPVRYQWQRSLSEAGPWQNVDGATSSRLKLAATLADDKTFYRCIVDSDGGSTISGVAQVRVSERPTKRFSISGRVLFQGAALADARVSINPIRGVRTGADGSYKITGLSRGEFPLRAELSRYVITPSAGRGERVVIANGDLVGQDFVATCAANYLPAGSECKVGIAPTPPSTIVASDSTSFARTLIRWSKVEFPGVLRSDLPQIRYRLYRSEVQGQRGTLLKESRVRTVIDTTGDAGKQYFYSVSTVLGGVESGTGVQDAGMRRRRPVVAKSLEARVAPLVLTGSSSLFTKEESGDRELRIVNRGTASEKFTVFLYDETGRFLRQESAVISPGRSANFSSGAEFGRGEYFLEIVPGGSQGQGDTPYTRELR